MKVAAFAALVAAVGIGAFYGYRVYSRHRDLKETLLWMDQTYNPHEGGDNFGQGHGWQIHYVHKRVSEEVAQKLKLPPGAKLVSGRQERWTEEVSKKFRGRARV